MVQNLSPQTTEASLSSLFEKFGTVQSVTLATDVMTGRCGGLGFVNVDEQDSGAALCALDGKSVGGRILVVTYEKKRDVHNYVS